MSEWHQQPTQFVTVGWNVGLEPLASAVGRNIDGPATQALHDDRPLQVLADVEGGDAGVQVQTLGDVSLNTVAGSILDARGGRAGDTAATILA